MSAQAHARTRTRAGSRRRPTQGPAAAPPQGLPPPRAAAGVRRRRRRALLLAVIVRPFADKAVQEISLPLRHEDIIRQQAEDKGLDPSLIAGVIYVESRFRDQTSHAGAKGLMQILPSTADYIARKSGGTAFEQGDLATPADQHRLRLLVPALPAAALPRQRAARARRLQRGRGQGRRVVPRGLRARRGFRGGDAHPVPRDPQLRRLGARGARALPPGVPEGAWT